MYAVLPKVAIKYETNGNNALEYTRYEVSSALESKNIKQEIKEKIKPKAQNYQFLSNMTLQAIYDLGDDPGFIIVLEKGKLITNILSLNEEFKGYKLIDIFPRYVVFTKNSKEYKLLLNNKKELNNIVRYEDNIIELQDENIVDSEDKITIKRDYLNSYVSNFDQIWKEIRIKEIKSPNSTKGIDGFKITYIKDNSVFHKLGLVSGDIIKSVNNIQLKSYNEAFKMYKKINDIKNINMEIQRDNEIMEINYEIN
jgi:general secretion pathway protein C